MRKQWFCGAPKSLQMVTAAMKLKDTCSLEEKLWPSRQHIQKQRHYFANKAPPSQSYGFSSSHVWMWELDYEESWMPKNWYFWTVVLENCWETLGEQGDPTSPSWRRLVLNIHWKDWCWSWNSNTLVTWCKELTHLKRPWYWERLRAGGEGDGRGDGWMASQTQWVWVWVNYGSWWWTRKPGMLQSMGLQRVGHSWVTELNLIFHYWISDSY